MNNTLLFLLGYLTDDQWKDALQAGEPHTDKDTVRGYMKQVEAIYSTRFEKAGNVR